MTLTVDATAKTITFTDTVLFSELAALPEVTATTIRGVSTVDLNDYRIVSSAGSDYYQCQNGAAEQLILREPADSNNNKIYISGRLHIGQQAANTYDYSWNNGHPAIIEINSETETQAVWYNNGRGSSGRYASIYVHSGGEFNLYGNGIQLTGSFGAHSSGSVNLYDSTLTAHYIYMYCAYNAYGKSRINVLGAMKLLGQLGDVSGLEIYDPANKLYLSSSGTTPSAIQIVRDLPRLPDGYKPWQGGSNYSTGIDFVNPAQDCTEFTFDSGTYTLRFSAEFQMDVATVDGSTPDMVTLYAGNGDWSEARYVGTSELIKFNFRTYEHNRSDTFYGYNNESKIKTITGAYGYTLAEQVYSGAGQYAKTYSMTLLPDASITERDAAVVSAYAVLSSAAEIHDAVSLWWMQNLKQYLNQRPTAREGAVIVTDYDVVIDPLSASLVSFDGQTLTIRANTIESEIVSAGTITFVNGATTSKSYRDVNGQRVRISGLDPLGLSGPINYKINGVAKTTLDDSVIETVPAGSTVEIVVRSAGYKWKTLSLDTTKALEIDCQLEPWLNLLSQTIYTQPIDAAVAAMFSYDAAAQKVSIDNQTGVTAEVDFNTAFRVLTNITHSEQLVWFFQHPMEPSATRDGFIVQVSSPLSAMMSESSNAGANFNFTLKNSDGTTATNRLFANSSGRQIIPATTVVSAEIKSDQLDTLTSAITQSVERSDGLLKQTHDFAARIA